MTRLTHYLAKFLTVFLFCLALGLGGAAHAGQLDDAKAAGWVGERLDGYVGVIAGAPATATALAGTFNAKRRAKYQGIAAANGTSLQAIEILMGEKLIARARPGEIVMDASGQWVRR
ncbi:MAG: YdbL family protein [Proteobacteria bacterium]|nr:YdbL family protein [Pseudomonadota bacterium]